MRASIGKRQVNRFTTGEKRRTPTTAVTAVEGSATREVQEVRRVLSAGTDPPTP